MTVRDVPGASASQFTLLRERRFAPFFLTQFCGALNDNIFKIGFTSLLTYQAARFGVADAKSAAFVISAIFILPFVLCSATAGQLADKYDKARLMRWVKTFEIGLTLVGAAGFFLHSAALLYLCTFLFGLHSSVFGPVKYAYLPQRLAAHELVGGNGLVEMGTFVAILLGTVIGGVAAAAPQGAEAWLGGICLAVALAGRAAVQRVPDTPALQQTLTINWNPVSETWRNLRLAGQDRTVYAGLLGISWLWFIGATYLASFFGYTKNVLGGDADVVTVLLAMFSLGIGLGSLLCETLSRRRVELGIVPLGMAGMTVFSVDLYLASRGLPTPVRLDGVGAFLAHAAHWRILADLFLLAMFGGLYSVPLYALIQSRSAPTHRARIIAANNILNALFMIASSVLALALTRLGETIPELFLVAGLLNLAMGACLHRMVPAFVQRFRAWLRREPLA